MTADASPATAHYRVAYSIRELAAMTGKTPKALRALHRKGVVPGRRLGREIMVPADFVAQYGPLPAGSRS